MQENLKQTSKIFYKKRLLILVSLFICLFSFMGLGASADTPAALAAGQPIATAFPDDNFRSYICRSILYMSTPSDDPTFANATFVEGDADKIAGWTSLDVRGYDMANLDGISYFTGMTNLLCRSEKIKTLDVSKNMALETLDCTYCSSLASLNVSGCGALKKLDCSHCGALKSLDVSNCGMLETLNCNSCEVLTSLDVKNFGTLTTLDCSHCKALTGLDVSGCGALKTLNCNNCEAITSLNVSNLEKLETLNSLFCELLTSLKVSDCGALKKLECGWCKVLKSLDISNCGALTKLSCISCSPLKSLDVSSCEALETLECGETQIENLNVSKCKNLKTLDFHSTAIKSLNVSGYELLETLECYTCNALTSLNVSSCKALKTLVCYSCGQLGNLDVNNCGKLEKLECYSTAITSLNVSGHGALKTLNCSSCESLESLDVSNCKVLETLTSSSCALLKSLNASGCGTLKQLDCFFWAKLETLNLENCGALETLNCYGTGITSLDVSSCGALTTLQCYNCNDIKTLDLKANTALQTLYCSSTGITELDLKANTALQKLNCSSTEITELDVKANTALQNLDCSYTGIKELDLKANTALQKLNCSGSNSLKKLDVDICEALEKLVCENSENLTELKLSKCGALKELKCSFCTALTNLDASGCTVLEKLYCENAGITNLDISKCTELKVLYCGGCKLNGIDLTWWTNFMGDRNAYYYAGLGNSESEAQTVSAAVYNKGIDIRYIDGPAIPSNAFSDLQIYKSYNGYSTVGNGAEYDAENNRIKILSKDVDGVVVRFEVKVGKNKSYRMYVKYNITKGKLTFDANGGTFVNGQPDPIILDFDENIPAENIPTANEGIYEVRHDTADFVEWKKEPEVDVMGKYGLNVYAEWKSRVGVTFDLNYSGVNVPELEINGSTDTSGVIENGKLRVIVGTPINEAITENQISATRPGYTFKGWTLDSLGKRPIEDTTTMLARDMKLFAQWEADSHTLTLLSNVPADDEHQPSQQSLTLEVKTDEKVLAAIKAKYGDKVITRDEWRLKGWTTKTEEDETTEKVNLLTNAYVMPANDLNLYAHWRRFSSTMNENMYIADVFVDDNFRSYIYSSIFGKAEPETEETFADEYMNAIRSTTYLNVSNKNISDLSGLSNFESLITLECNGNSITELDVSDLKKLKYLGCSSNSIENLSLGEEPIISRLTIYNCGLNELDVSKCKDLANLLCYDNNLKTLDVSKNEKLSLLECQNNKLEALDLSNKPELTNLNCSNNAINKIDLSSNKKLTTVSLSPQNLYLEVSKDEDNSNYTVSLGQGITMAEGDAIASKYSSETGMVTWNSNNDVDNFTYTCNTNNANFPMEVNVFSMVPVVLNVNGGMFKATGKTDNETVLYKVKTEISNICEEITNDSNYAVDSKSNIFVAWRSNCVELNGDGCELEVDWVETIEGHTFKEIFPDINFRNFVINKILATEVGISDNSLITADQQQMLLAVSNLDVSGKAIKSLEGIKYFANLENLNCANNNLQKLELGNLKVLGECTYDNQIANVILSKDENDQWQVQLPEGLTTLVNLNGTYDSTTGLVTWNKDVAYDQDFMYEYPLKGSFKGKNMSVTVKPSMKLKFDANGGKFRNGTPEDIAVPYGATIKDYISGYDRKTYEPTHDDSNTLFLAWSLKSGADGVEQTELSEAEAMNDQEVTLYAIWKSIKEKIEYVTDNDLSSTKLIKDNDPSKNDDYINNLPPNEKASAIAKILGKTENKETYTQAFETVSLSENVEGELTEDVKKKVDIIKNAIAEVNHNDTTNHISVSGTGGNELDWDIKLSAKPREIVREDLLGQSEKLDEVLSSAQKLMSFDISLAKLSVNEDGVLDETEYEPEDDGNKEVELIVPNPYTNPIARKRFEVVYIHFKKDGTTEIFRTSDKTLERIDDGAFLKLKVKSFSNFVYTGKGGTCCITFDLNDGIEAAFNGSEELYVLETDKTYAKVDKNGIPESAGSKSVSGNLEFLFDAGYILNDQGNKSETYRGLFNALNRTAIAKNKEGKMFYKWNTKDDGTGAWVDPGAEEDAWKLVTEYENKYGEGLTFDEKTEKTKLTLYAIWTLPGDFNGDGKVDNNDLAYITNYYNKYGNNLPGDYFARGRTNLDDLSVWLQYYGQTDDYNYATQKSEEQV